MSALALASSAAAQIAMPASAGAADPALGTLALIAACVLVAVGAVAAAAGWLAARQRYAGRLHTARSDLRLTAQLASTWTWQTDADHRLLFWRPPPNAPHTAWAQEASVGHLLWEALSAALPAVAGPGAATAVDALRSQLQAHGVLQSLTVLRHAGAAQPPQRWRLSGQPRFDADGQFDGYLGVAEPLDAEEAATIGRPPSGPAQDIPGEAAATSSETTLRQPADRIADQTATQAATQAATSATATAAERASDADHESFTYSVSHDLRAPIRVVDGFARILKEDYGRFLDRIGNDHVDRVLAAAARMNSMIDALLALSRLQSQPLARKPVDLSQLAHYIVEDLKRESPERSAQVSIEPGIVVQGDPTLLRIAMENLLGNAWKYSGKCPLTQIEFRRETRNGQRTLMVGDNGAGFDMRFADRLFGVFQRLHSAKDFQGTGIGLASVRRIVHRHGGDIWAESDVGHGARFYFTLSS